VEINIKDLSQISLKMPQVLWRNQQQKLELPGQIGIDQVHRLYTGELKGGQTVVTPSEPKHKGFNLVGQLTLETFNRGSSMGKTTYNDIYVAFEGVEEITEKLASAKEHREGFVQVPITDIRQFYTDYGLLFQDINTRLATGPYDPRTVQEGGDPWSLVQVMQFLFSQLPGTPKIHPESDSFSMGANPPSEIIGEGEPVSGFIEILLKEYGLIAKFLPDGTFLIRRKYVDKVTPGKIASSPGQITTYPF